MGHWKGSGIYMELFLLGGSLVEIGKASIGGLPLPLRATGMRCYGGGKEMTDELFTQFLNA